MKIEKTYNVGFKVKYCHHRIPDHARQKLVTTGMPNGLQSITKKKYENHPNNHFYPINIQFVFSDK